MMTNSPESATKIQHVVATFGGEDLRFALVHDHVLMALPALRKPYETFHRFGAGQWTPQDVENVLVAAYPWGWSPA